MTGANDADDWEWEAAEYVLGTLTLDERMVFADRLQSDAAARLAVAAWERRFADLADQVAPVQPSPEVWTRIERAITTSGAKPTPFKVIDGGGRPGVSPSSLQASRNRWRAAALACGTIAAALIVFIAGREINGGGETVPATYVAAVNRGGDKPALLIRVDLNTRQVFIRPVAAEAPANHSLELWYIGDGNKPRSMGLVEGAPETLQMPKDASDHAATFAVSVEPPGGSKTGGPTGPVVYSGQLIKE